MIDILKSSINLNNFILLKTTQNKIIIFKTFYKYTKCIYINKTEKSIEVNIDKVFDNSMKYRQLERILISRKNFCSIEESIPYIQENIVN